MKVVFRIIGSEEDLKDIEGKEENVHFCFRPSEKNIFELVSQSHKIKTNTVTIVLPENNFKHDKNAFKNEKYKTCNWGYLGPQDRHRPICRD